MHRSRALFALLALLGLLTVAPGCPSGAGDDDDATGDDDDATGDDDDATGNPCDSVSDITDNINGDPVTGATTGSSGDVLTGSCGEGSPGAPEAVFAVTPNDSGLMIASTDNGLTDFDTVLYVLGACDDPTSELACNDDVAQGVTTSEVVWQATAGTTYYIVVDGYEAAGGFELTVEIAVCGDGVVSAGEQCDDGDEDDGDGCSSTCTWECVDDSNEDDDGVQGATVLDGSTLPSTFSDLVLCPNDLDEELGVYADFWAVDLAAGEYLWAEVTGGASLTPTCADQTLGLALVDADLNGFGGAETTEGECAQAAFEAEEAGTYYIAVFWDDQTVAPQDYTLSVDAGVSECGDGELEGIEECDDDNNDSGDGCSPTCVLEDATCTVLSAVEANIGGSAVTGSTAAATDDHEPQECGVAGGAADDVYSLTVTEDTTVIVNLDNPGTDYDTVAYVRQNCTDPGSEIACNDDGPDGTLASVLFFDALKDVTYYIVVDGYDADGGSYEMTLTVPVCGDGNVDLNEDCDDMNGTLGDGCENDCTFTPICDYTVDEALGMLTSGANTHTVTLLAGSDDLPDLPCSDAGGGDHLLSFSLPTAGDVEIAYTQTGDAQMGLFTPGGDCAAGTCEDPVQAAEGSFTILGAAAGEHLLLIEAWADGDEGTVSLTITVP
jgi:cysteine-rich repeat protein